jgi:hypothetical protein
MLGVSLDNLSFAVFRVVCRVVGERPVRLPPYAGSALHGALGWALRRVQAGNRAACRECPVFSDCRYSSLFAYLFRAPAEHPFIVGAARRLRDLRGDRELRGLREFPPPCIIDPPPGGLYEPEEEIVFRLVLVGRAVRYFPFLVCGLEELAAGYLGADRRARLRLEEIAAVDCLTSEISPPLYSCLAPGISGGAPIFDYDDFVAQTFSRSNSVLTLHFVTPLRFRVAEKISSKLDFPGFYRLLLRRLLLLSVHSPLPDDFPFEFLRNQAAEVVGQSCDLDFGAISRRGGRQLYGALGKLVVAGVLPDLLPAVRLGGWLHIGKATTLGFGRYEVLVDPGGGSGERAGDDR